MKSTEVEDGPSKKKKKKRKKKKKKKRRDPKIQEYSVVPLLRACAQNNDLHKGSRLHTEIVNRGLYVKNVYVGSTLINMYSKCGALAKAQEVFDELPARDVVSWTALIAGYAQHGHGREAINWFNQMQLAGLPPDAVTFACILKACGSIRALDKGQQVHAEIVRQGLLERNLVVGTALVDMYAKCGAVAKAQEVFDEIPVWNSVSCNAMITGYAQHGYGKEAIDCFERMQLAGLLPNAVTFACILKACGSIGALKKGQEIHTEVARQSLLEKDVMVGTAVVDMYAKCGAMSKAQKVFDELPVRNAVSWNALIAGYAQQGNGEEAINYFQRMRLGGLSPDAFTFACILKACGSIGAAYKGQQVHADIVRNGLLHFDVVVGNALVDMYAKCGALAKAQEVFDELPLQDVVAWNALIGGYALLGNDTIVLNSLNGMVRKGKEPDLVTFNILLNTCSHLGLVDKGQLFFETMSKGYGVIPTSEHHACMVDLFGRAGHLDKAVAVVKEMPFSANLLVWHTVLGSCQKWGSVKLARLAFEHVTLLDEKDAAAYVCMSNIYAAAGMQKDSDIIEAMRVKKQAWEKPECERNYSSLFS